MKEVSNARVAREIIRTRPFLLNHAPFVCRDSQSTELASNLKLDSAVRAENPDYHC